MPARLVAASLHGKITPMSAFSAISYRPKRRSLYFHE